MNTVEAGAARAISARLVRWTMAAALIFGASLMPASIEALEADAPEARPTDSFAGNYLAGRFAVLQRDKDAAALFLGAALDQNPDDESLLDQAFVAALAAGAYDDAIARAGALVKADGENRLARITLAADALRGRKYAQVSKMIGEGFENPLANITGVVLQAWAMAGDGQSVEALARIEALDDLGNADIRRIKDYAYGMLAEYGGNASGALAAFQRAYDVASNNVRVVEALARAEARAGNFDRARELAQGYEERAPGHAIIGQVLKAVDAERAPPSPASTPQAGAAETVFTIGAALGRDATDEMAVMFYQLSLLLKHDAELPLLGLAAYFDAVGDHAASLATLERIDPASIHHANADISKARLLDKMEKTEEAMEILDALAIALPGRDVFLAQASILHTKKRFVDAAAAYTRAIAATDEIRDADWYLFYYRGMVRERAKQWPKAELDFKRALKLNPEQPNVLNYLGYSWIDQGVNLDEALKLVKRAVELRPKDGDIVDSLGWAYYRLGRYEEAVKTLEQAVELRAEEPVIHDHLGDAYWKVGRRFEAKFQWQHALDRKPEDDELVKTIIHKLQYGLPDAPEQKAAQAGD